MNEKELYDLAINNVKKYSMLNEIFAIRDKRVEKDDYSIAVNGYISLDELNRYVRYIDRLVNYQNICTVKELKELQEKANKYDKLFSDWNQLEEWLKEEIKRLDNYMMSLNYSPQGDLPITYYHAEYKKQAKDKVLSKMQEVQRGIR